MKKSVKCNTPEQMRETEHRIKEAGFKKTADCMWVKVYTLENTEIIVTREWY